MRHHFAGGWTVFTDACLVGRQPILNGLEEIMAFELLFRSPSSISSATVENHTQASSRVILNTLSAIGTGSLLGSHQGFVNIDRELLMSDVVELIPPQAVGLELLESLAITPDVVERCRDLKSRGYVLALDDHVYDPLYEPLYDGVVDIVKIDLFSTPLTGLSEIVNRFRRYPVKLLAEKVDSRDVFLRCRSNGFELFQGFFFARPSLIQKQRMESCVQCFLKLMQQLTDDAEISEIETTFKGSPLLIYKLLTLVNSVAFGLHEKIRSIPHALNIIGRHQLKRWVQIALFAIDGRQESKNPIMYLAVARATFMEELARTQPGFAGCQPDEAFLTGTLSVLKEIYDISVEELSRGLKLSDNILGALNGTGCHMGMLLKLATMVERGRLDEAAGFFSDQDIPLASMLECQKKAFDSHLDMMCS